MLLTSSFPHRVEQPICFLPVWCNTITKLCKIKAGCSVDTKLFKVIKIYGVDSIDHIPLRYEEFSDMQVFGQVFISLKSRSQRSTAVMAIWPSIMDLY